MNISATLASAPPAATLRFEPPPAALAPHILGFVLRDDLNAGGVVRWLPEVRASVQIMLADAVWMREAAEGGAWRRLPRVALWGPRHDWAYGYARRHIRAYAFGLTALGLRALTREPAADFVNNVGPLHLVAPALADALDPKDGELFDCWRARAGVLLASFFAAAPALADPVAPALPILATAGVHAVERAAQACGLSVRHFRRVFLEYHGVTPKRWQRAVRVDRTLRQLHVQPWEEDTFPEPTDFSDQPHAIREFRRLTGVTPVEYLRAKRSGDATLRSLRIEGVEPPEARVHG